MSTLRVQKRPGSRYRNLSLQRLFLTVKVGGGQANGMGQILMVEMATELFLVANMAIEDQFTADTFQSMQ